MRRNELDPIWWARDMKAIKPVRLRHRSGPGYLLILSTICQQHSVHEGRTQLSQGWYTGSTLVRAAK
jgi:hypothetical protein